MTLATPQSRFTPQDLLDLDSDLLYELVDGQLVEKKMSSLASETAGIVTAELRVFLKKSRGGKVYPEQTFQCFPHDPELIRRPDVAFVSCDRVGGVPKEGQIGIAPDLAVEVVSPNDKIYELNRKLADYRGAGIKLIWVIDPDSRKIMAYRMGHSVAEFPETETITGESVIPGFSILVKDLLPELEPSPR